MNLLYRRNIMYPQQSVYVWLTKAAVQAIIDAFGVDGTAVIQATKEYLNGIAASDMAKATALASYINEDPMMVCSLGLEPQGVTMSVRWIIGDNVAYIDSGIYPNSNTIVRAKAKFVQTTSLSGISPLIGGRQAFMQSDYSLVSYNATWRTVYGNSEINGLTLKTNMDVEVVKDKNVSTLTFQDGTVVTDTRAANTFTTPVTMFILGMNNGGTPFEKRTDNAWGLAGILIDNTAHLVPCKHNGQNGMYDIERMRWFGNANSQGSFTIPDIFYTPTP